MKIASNKSHGIYDRFPAGYAWYDSVHSSNQVQGIKNASTQMTFYSSAQFSTVNGNNRGSMYGKKAIAESAAKAAK